MNPLTIALAATKMLGGIFANRASKRQAKNQLLQSSIASNLAQVNALQNATIGYGRALVAANRSGGFAPGVFSTSFSNLAADLRRIFTNQLAQNNGALANASVGRMSLLGNAMNVFGNLAGSYLSSQMPKSTLLGGSYL
jgi:hypothetical protein